MRRDFRTAYLNALGFKGGSQLKTSLEAIFEHRVIDLGKLKKICNLFDIPNQYRSKVWRILLGVTSSYQESWDLVLEQRTIEYEDIKDAVLSVKRNLTVPLNSFYSSWKENSQSTDEQVIKNAIQLASTGLTIIYTTKEQYFNYQNSLYYIATAANLNQANNNIQNNQNNNQNHNTNTNNNTNNQISNHNNNNNSNNHYQHNNTHHNNQHNQHNQNSTSFQKKPQMDLSFSIFDLQKANSNDNKNNNNNNKNNNNNNNNNFNHNSGISKHDLDDLIKRYTTQMNVNNNNKSNLQEFQVDETLRSMAEVFCYVCESEVDAYWCLNNFLNLPLKQYGHKDIGLCHQINSLTRLLEIHDRGLSFHFKHHKIHVDMFSTVWFKSFFTCCFPTNSMDRIWDRIIGVSLDYMAYISLAILQSKKPLILDKTNKTDILNYLLNKDLNVDMILEKSVELFGVSVNEETDPDE
ncbi:hypothetical protein DDB_G0288949 [Dictyostelium discoideum AX4]|uniref:TBC1 domain family member 7 n=1 Tax=Dictyostelium discoideum TaxID=44689 RepID=Q54IA2_DICDI|nr:hypothetical protein DDB_G0288949 [Dictyostelium discoideum AX4]EAL62998.1 hypothetical protein DDB_G0288949 [Dictyostelium discoideum AX4]|eukprot:XP_636477.1 hypothetical protein DDB_G0288949 [Dictyostelium discoideum AX4]